MEPRGPQTTIAPLLGPSVEMLNWVKFTTLNNKIFANFYNPCADKIFSTIKSEWKRRNLMLNVHFMPIRGGALFDNAPLSCILGRPRDPKTGCKSSIIIWVTVHSFDLGWL